MLHRRSNILGYLCNNISQYTVDLVIFASLDFCEFVILGLFSKSRIRQLSTSMIGSAHINKIRETLKFAKLKPREYSQIYSILRYLF